jgi:hypothetical protein
MSRLLDWPRSAGPFGNHVTKPILRKKIPKNHVELIYQSVAFMKYWTGSHNAADASQLQQGADALLNLAMGSAATRNNAAGASDVPRLTARLEGDMEVDEDDPKDADDLGA